MPLPPTALKLHTATAAFLLSCRHRLHGGISADDGPGNHRLPPPVGHRWTISRRRGVCARETAGSGRVSGALATAVVILRNDGRAVAHLSKSRRAARRRDAIADRMLGVGDHRPALGRGRMMAVGTFDVCSNAAVNSGLSCFLYTL